jgi:AbrB family transcriptional regulator (stage V sporulation protein T)
MNKLQTYVHNKNVPRNIRRLCNLKATGIVRRIDELGRVVIPKEIRKTLRIREGDPLEIFTDKDGEVILKKYSPIGELSDFASQIAESVQKTIGHTTCITDRDNVIAVFGGLKKDYLEKQLSMELEKIIEDKSTIILKENEDRIISIVQDDTQRNYSSQLIAPIISEGDPIGSIIIFSTDKTKQVGDAEKKVALSAANFLGRQMEQ